MKKFLIHIILVAFFGVTSIANAQTPEASFEKANTHYADGQYQEAVDIYMKVVEGGLESAALYYNLGNAHYKLNHVAPANYYYEKAKQLAPSDSDLRNNAAFAENMRIDAIEPLPENTFTKWFHAVLNTFTVDEWAYVTVIFVFAFVLLFLGYYFTFISGKKRLFFITAFSSLILGGFSLICAYSAFAKAEKDRPAIVFSTQSEVKSEPNLRSTVAFTLHEGTKVLILEETKDWKRIQLVDGKSGWILAEEIREL
ncbi:MAG: tetratricopeptide (TPR) repeat protein [Flavobacteriales bacterium]|jgi:tetratricopeptide (TPR) repeat protein